MKYCCRRASALTWLSPVLVGPILEAHPGPRVRVTPSVCHRGAGGERASACSSSQSASRPSIAGMQRLQRLSGLDASFLYLETSTQPLHVCSVLELDASTIPGGYRFEALRDALAARVAAIPAFREKLANSMLNLDHPVWVEDPEFDVDRHLHRVGLPAPGGRVELAEICGHLASLPLDRRRPLWEMWVIEGLGGTDARGGRLAVLTRCITPPSTGSPGPTCFLAVPSNPTPRRRTRSRPVPGPIRCGSPSAVWFVSPRDRSTSRPACCPRRCPPWSRRSAGRPVAGHGQSVHRAADPFNARITAHRNVAFAQLDLDAVKRVGITSR